MSNKVNVFVYGTLLKGFRNEHFLANCECLCDEALTTDNGELILFYDRPFIDFSKPRYKIKGALFEIGTDILGHLDELEGHPVWYRRIEKKIYSPSLGEEILAFCYELNQAPEIKFATAHTVGCYRDFMSTYDGDEATNYEIRNEKIVRLG